jgi:hypothetical protein
VWGGRLARLFILVSGHRFSDAVSRADRIAPSGADILGWSFSATSFSHAPCNSAVR